MTVTQTPLQSVWSGGHEASQRPIEQMEAPRQTLPQAPQLRRSDAVSRQRPEQKLCPMGHGVVASIETASMIGTSVGGGFTGGAAHAVSAASAPAAMAAR